jgi:hypothetical protein
MMSRSVVVQHDPVRHRRRGLLAFVILVVVFLIGLVGGGFSGYQMLWSVAAENAELKERVIVQARLLEELQQWQADNSTRGEVDSATLELVRQELASQQEMIAELDRGIRFYKSLMAPGELAEGLNVRSVDLMAGELPGRYQFRVLVQQSARKHELLTGTLNVRLLGSSDGAAVEFDLSELSAEVPKADIRLRFKYFQAIDGEMELPAGFIPKLVRVSAKSTKPRRSEISEEFPWSVQEKLSHVGK